MHHPQALATTQFALRNPPFQPLGLRTLALALAACAVLTALMMVKAGIGFDVFGGSLVYELIIVGCALVRFRLRGPVTGRLEIIRDFAEYSGLFMTMSLLGAVASYPLAAFSHGFADASLARIDRMLHFDWLGWYQLVAAHPALQTAGRAAYANIYFSPMLLIAGFAWTRDREGAQFFLVSFWAAAVITLALFAMMPAVGPLSYLWHGPISYMPTSGVYQAQLLPLLRSGTMDTVDLGQLQGLVCTPSFHTASAIIYIVLGWRNDTLRRPLLALNCAMLLATPVEGTHYLIDMIGGALVALVALVATRAALRLPARALQLVQLEAAIKVRAPLA